MAKTYVERVEGPLYVLRVDDEQVLFFEGLWEIPEHISYNAYLLVSENKVVLFDGWKADYSGEFLEALQQLVDPRDITDVVLHHMEPDHTGSIPFLAAVNSKAVFHGHPLAGRMLRSFYGIQRFNPLQDGASLDLGVRARFIHTPWLHWPETSMTFLEGLGVLLSCDAFGSYSLFPLFDDAVDLDAIEHAVRKYFVTVIGHYASFVTRALDKLSDLGIKPRVIAPGHGIIWRHNTEWVTSLYARLARGESRDAATVIYVSMYGNTADLARRVAKLLEEKGLRMNIYSFTDKTRDGIADALASAAESRIVVLGAATYESEIQPLMRYVVELIGEKLSYRKDLAFLVLSPYGWSGVAGKKLAEMLRGYGFTKVEIVEWEGTPTPEAWERVSEKLKALV